MKPKLYANVKYNIQKDFVVKMLKTKKVRYIANHYGCTNSNIYVFCKKNNIKIPEINLIGKTWNMLKVVEKLDSRGEPGRQSRYWRCLCECGKSIEISTKAINVGSHISCGCWMKSKEYREKSWCWSGCGDIHGKWWGNIKRAASKRKHKFSISIEYAWELFLSQGSKCALTGIEIKFGRCMKEIERGATTASLDRINNKLGYIKGNVHWVHKDINLMKQRFDLDHFVKMCELVSANCRNRA